MEENRRPHCRYRCCSLRSNSSHQSIRRYTNRYHLTYNSHFRCCILHLGNTMPRRTLVRIPGTHRDCTARQDCRHGNSSRRLHHKDTHSCKGSQCHSTHRRHHMRRASHRRMRARPPGTPWSSRSRGCRVGSAHLPTPLRTRSKGRRWCWCCRSKVLPSANNRTTARGVVATAPFLTTNTEDDKFRGTKVARKHMKQLITTRTEC
jgi:hypothetical protein